MPVACLCGSGRPSLINIGSQVLAFGPKRVQMIADTGRLAARDDASLNQFIVTAVSEKISDLNTEAFFQERAERGLQERALDLIDHGSLERKGFLALFGWTCAASVGVLMPAAQ